MTHTIPTGQSAAMWLVEEACAARDAARRRPAAMYTVDQSKVDAPDFPRDVDWWRRFMPMWVAVDPAPDGGTDIVLRVDSRLRAQSVEGWLAGCARGRLARSWRRADQPVPK